MKLTCISVISLLASILLLILFLLRTNEIYKRTVTDLYPEINQLFRDAIIDEAIHRLTENNIPFTFYTYPIVEPKENVTIRMDAGEGKIDSVVIKKTDRFKNLTLKQQQIENAQTILLYEELFPNPWDLDSIFRKNLREENLYVPTAVKMSNNITQEIITTIPSEKFSEKAYHTEEIITGLNDELTFEACYNLSWWRLRHRLGKNFMYVLICAIVNIFIVFFLLYRMLQTNKNLKIKPGEEKIMLFPDVYLYKDQCLLQGKYQTVTLTTQMVILFELFAIDSERFASYNQITKRLWGNMADPTDRLTQLIKRTREKIQPLTEINIENISGMGYCLVLMKENKLI